MPIPRTKYNKVTILQNEISNNSINNINYFSCYDVSYIPPPQQNIYLNSKASYLIHEYSCASNFVTKFNNIKPIYQYKKPFRTPEKDVLSNINPEINQKIIQNQVRAKGSLYTMNLASLTGNREINNSTTKKPWNNASDRSYDYSSHKNNINRGVDIKHNSYDRYLNRKKANYLKSDPQPQQNIKALFGNKTRKFGLINSKTCLLNC